MASNGSATIALLLLSLNLLILSMANSGNTISKHEACPIDGGNICDDALKFSGLRPTLCCDFLPSISSQAADCACAMAKANILGSDDGIGNQTTALLKTCKKKAPPGFTCQ